MGPKYEFTDERKTVNDHILHRIKRISDGQLGGFIEKEENLNQEGNCWVADNACVWGDAQVSDNAQISSNAQISNDAQIGGNAKVYDNAIIHGNAWVYGNAEVSGTARVFGHAHICDNAQILGNASVWGNAKIYDSAIIHGNSKIYDNAKVHGNADIYENAEVYNNAEISGNVLISDDNKVDYNIGVSEVHYTTKTSSNMVSSNIIEDFIYKIDDSQKLEVQTEYESLNEFFNEPIANDIKLDTVIICAVDTKEPIIKLEKVKNEEKTDFKFIVDITNDQGEEFMFKSIIKTSEQLDQLVQQTVDALKYYPQFVKYIDDLENYL